VRQLEPGGHVSVGVGVAVGVLVWPNAAVLANVIPRSMDSQPASVARRHSIRAMGSACVRVLCANGIVSHCVLLTLACTSDYTHAQSGARLAWLQRKPLACNRFRDVACAGRVRIESGIRRQVQINMSLDIPAAIHGNLLKSSPWCVVLCARCRATPVPAALAWMRADVGTSAVANTLVQRQMLVAACRKVPQNVT